MDYIRFYKISTRKQKVHKILAWQVKTLHIFHWNMKSIPKFDIALFDAI